MTLPALLSARAAADEAFQIAFARYQRTGAGVDYLAANAARRDRQIISGMVDDAVK